MNSPVRVLVSIRTAAILGVVLEHLANLGRSGMAHLAIDGSDSEAAANLITRLEQRGVKVNHVPAPEDLATWGLEHLGLSASPVVEGESCESGNPDCGPVEFHDGDGVPLCRTCFEALEESPEDSSGESTSDTGSSEDSPVDPAAMAVSEQVAAADAADAAAVATDASVSAELAPAPSNE